MASSLIRRKQDVDMTCGSISPHLIRFALPLLVGNLFQQMYTMVDAWVVGNFVSNEAFSAVGSVSPILNTLVGIFIGLSGGAGAVISQLYGAKQMQKVHDSVHTAMLMTLLLGIVFTGVGILMTPFMLRLMNTPPSVIPEATTYLTICFSGICGLMLYNICSGILRAVGNSKYPFYFLVICAVVNTALDLLFVLCLGMGVEGVALATITAQAISAVLSVLLLMRSKECVRLTLSHLRIHWDMLRKILRIGIPTAIQMAVTSFSNVYVQSYINYFGEDFMSGWTAYLRIDQLMFLPMQSLSLAATTFVGQNLGAGYVQRARRGANLALLSAVISTAILMVPLLLFSKPLVGFFNGKAEVVAFGSMLLQWLSPFYLLCCINQVYGGALRGAGNSVVPTAIMLGSFVAFRQVYLYIMANFICNEPVPIAMSYPAGWILCSGLMFVYYCRVNLAKTNVTTTFRKINPRSENNS